MDGPTRAANIKFALVDGAADSATAGLDVEAKDGTALAYGDQLIAVVNIATTTNLPEDETADSSINSSDKLLCPASASDKIAVWWMACTSDADQMASPMIEGDLVDGAAANTNMATTGVKTGDSLVCAVEIATSTGAWTDRTDATSITSDGNVQCTAATTNDTMLLMWHAKDNVTAEASMYLRFTLASMGLSDESDITVTGIKTEDQVLACYATDETSALGLDEVSAEVEITADDTIRIDQVSPTVTAGCDLWVFWVDRELVS
jgi:hypothetical protein